MKKLIAILICALTLLVATLPAQGKTITDLSDSASAELTVKIVYSSAGVNALVKDGSVDGTLPDGTDFSVEDLPDSTYSLIVHPIEESEEDVHDWIDSHIGEEYDVYQAYYVAAQDENGNTVPHAGAEITLQLPDGEKKSAITLFYLDTEGKTSSQQLEIKNGTVNFTADHSSYYVFCTPNKNPGTSDLQITAYILLAVAAITLIGFVWLRKKARNAKA